jgi:hypothetical protein
MKTYVYHQLKEKTNIRSEEEKGGKIEDYTYPGIIAGETFLVECLPICVTREIISEEIKNKKKNRVSASNLE